MSGNIILQATSLLTFGTGAAVNFTGNTNLLLTTDSGAITLNTGADLTASGGKHLTVTLLAGTSGAGGSISLNSNIVTNSSGGVTLQASGNITINGGLISTPVLDISTTNGGNVTQSGGTLDVTKLQNAGSVAGSVSLLKTHNTHRNLECVWCRRQFGAERYGGPDRCRVGHRFGHLCFDTEPDFGHERRRRDGRLPASRQTGWCRWLPTH